jgi:hypothetical protein
MLDQAVQNGDGNEIAGIRLPELTAPRATYTGWALRAGPQANDGCEGSGQDIPFPKTKAERQASGDPRKSLAERYKSMVKYRKEVARAIDNLVRDRFLPCEDTGAMLARLIQAGLVNRLGCYRHSTYRFCRRKEATRWTDGSGSS